MELLKQFELTANQRPLTTAECAFLLQALTGGLERIRDNAHDDALVREIADALRLFPSYVTGTSKVPRSRVLLDLARATAGADGDWGVRAIQYAQITGINLAYFPRQQLLAELAGSSVPAAAQKTE
jgi:hypothetical protein